jgi:predicted DNA-binding transcriptional regulator YafY
MIVGDQLPGRAGRVIALLRFLDDLEHALFGGKVQLRQGVGRRQALRDLRRLQPAFVDIAVEVIARTHGL